MCRLNKAARRGQLIFWIRNPIQCAVKITKWGLELAIRSSALALSLFSPLLMQGQ